MSYLMPLRDAVDGMIKTLVQDPDSVEIFLTTGEREDVLHIVTSERDRGVVLGKQGRTIRALRVFVQAASRKVDRVVSLDIVISRGKAPVDLNSTPHPNAPSAITLNA
jgi:predicted RNA-binding protein YlqC (UPF0109 family)